MLSRNFCWSAIAHHKQVLQSSALQIDETYCTALTVAIGNYFVIKFDSKIIRSKLQLIFKCKLFFPDTQGVCNRFKFNKST